MKALVVLLLSVSMYAQVSSDRAVSPIAHRQTVEYPDDSLERKYVALESAMVASAAFDAGTTIHNLNNGCHENNPLVGSHPSTAHIVAFEAGWTAGELVIAHFLRKHHPKVASLFLGESVIEHGVAGGLNSTQRCF